MWNSVIGQSRAKEILQRAIVTNKIAHAYCFWGAEGIGKDALALEFARVTNCYHPIILGNTAEACGECKSCVQHSHLQHPNISLIFSLPTGKAGGSDDESPLLRLSDEQITTIQEQLAVKAQNHYHNISIPSATQIKIVSIRDVKKTIQLSQAQQGRRVVIISEADEMTTEAANAFLKTLEEPHSNVTLIITTSRKEMLPQTILSRCQQINLEPLNDDELTQALIERNELNEQTARLTASLAQGSYSKAIELLNEDTQQLRNDIVDVLRSALRNVTYRQEVVHSIDSVIGNTDRKDVEKMLMLLMVWLRDASVIAATQSTDSVINIDQKPVLERFAEVFRDKNFVHAIEHIEQAIRAIRQNAQVQLTMITLLISLRRIFLA
ncbi:MAG: AAA family ATPase [Candidatus Kapaibacterium sp.]|nr:AAA family ATPase [Bacteroidota bacterium]